MTHSLRLALAGALTLATAASASGETKLLRFPDVHADRIAFCYAGDLWLAASSGGTARRLTAHPGLELFPRFSPDGKWIAFTGQYDGDEQVYVMPAEGGVPRQLTFYPARGPMAPRWGYDHQVYGWTPDGRSILFRSTREGFTVADSRLYVVDVAGGLPRPLPMPNAGVGDFSPDGRRIAYSPLFRDFRTWKRYQGGWAQDLWIFDLDAGTAENFTDDVRTDREPMWIAANRILFASDRSGVLNLYAYDLATRQTTPLTRSETWDVRWPSADPQGHVVYELGGELRLLDAASGVSHPIPIDVPDDGIGTRPSRVSAEKQIEDFALSPGGERALFVARGDVFTAPIEKGPTRNLTRSSNAHDKWARWSPDGRRIAFVSDLSGEDEIYLVDQDGSGEPERLTSDGAMMRYAAEWSPDGKQLAFSDKDGRLFVLGVEDRSLRNVADDTRTQISDYVWSPDSAWLAFSMTATSRTSTIHIWSAESGDVRAVTSPLFDERTPAWDPGGRYLFFLSDREFAPQISGMEWNYATNRSEGIYALALRRDVPHPFPPESDEVASEKEKKEKKEKEDEEKKTEEKPSGAAPPPVSIDFEGIADRVARVPVEADNYQGLVAAEGRLLYVRSGPFYYGRTSDRKPELLVFSMEKREAKTLADDVEGWALSRDGAYALVQHPSGFARYEAKLDGAGPKKDVSTAGLVVDRIPKQEWVQIFDEVWRRYRDFFYVPNMHGYQWDALQERYQTLLEFVAHRSDLNYVIGEMLAELSVGHAYIQGGDWEAPERAKVALLGADLALDTASGRYRLAHIFNGQKEEPAYRAPLTEVGVDVRQGDYLLAIDGRELGPQDNPYAFLRHKADRPVELTVNGEPDLEGARRVSVRPITDESKVRYLDWVEGRRAVVTQATGGRVGYLHVPDMGSDGIYEFIKWFYPQIDKQGLIIDVRGNGGGNVSQMLIERLGRKLLGTRFARTSDEASTYPEAVFRGYLVCLLNEDSASDGDIFPAMFRQAGLGPLIGKRSWGGVVGITNRGPLVDGGAVFVPEFSTNSPTGEYVIEGEGVSPDIVVENDPPALIAGRDPQLERAIEEILKRIEAEPRPLPARPPDPVKTQGASPASSR
jgi:tricorn protease